MKSEEKKMKKYIKAVKRRLNLPSAIKKRVMNDFICSIQSRREAGKTDEEIFTELGPAANVAVELNEQMKEFTYVKSPWRWGCLVITILSAIGLVWKGIIGLFVYTLTRGEDASIGIIGGADGPTAIFVTTNPAPIGYTIIVPLILLVLGGVGFYLLGHKKRK